MASDLDGKVILITGATDGLGRGVARELAAAGATVLLHGRDAERGRATREEIERETGSDRLGWYQADLSSLDEVRNLAAQVERDQAQLHGVVNNAGIGSAGPGDGRRVESRDGLELRFAVNYLAGYLLTRRLEPLLVRSTPARVVNVSSAGQAPIDFDDVQLEHRYSGIQAYCQSKLAQIMFAFDLAERLQGTGVTATCLHPATFMPTKMVRAAGAAAVSDLVDGVRATTRLIADPAVEGVTGRYFDGVREARANPQAYDEDARRRLRELSDRLTGLTPVSA